MKRLDQAAGGLVVAGVDGVEDLVDKSGRSRSSASMAELWFLCRGGGGDVLALAHPNPRNAWLPVVPPSYCRAESGASGGGSLNRRLSTIEANGSEQWLMQTG